jgi:hypothetical protein
MKTPVLVFPAEFASTGLNGSWTQPIEINQHCRLSQRRIIATGAWHFSNNKSLELLGLSRVLRRSITRDGEPLWDVNLRS